MNARLYDPVLGRMLSPDNYIQAADNTQSYNRYSYCWNNPLKYTDPSGNVLGAMFFASAFLGETGSNLIHGESNPFGKAYNSAQSASSEVGNLGQISLYNNGYTSVTAGIDIFGLGLSVNYSYHDGDFAASAGVGVGLMSGPSANAGISEQLHFGDKGSITLGGSGSTNFKTYSVGASAAVGYDGYSLGYGYNYYGGQTGNGYGHQYTGSLSIGLRDFHASHENDFLAFGNSGDKFRTAALGIGVGVFSIGALINTNDPLRENSEVDNRPSKIWGFNKSSNYNSWSNGKVFNSSIYAQYKNGSSVSRLGWNGTWVQDFLQNGMHQNDLFRAGNQNYYLDYQFSSGLYIYGGFPGAFYTR